jgi:hypothetical protein
LASHASDGADLSVGSASDRGASKGSAGSSRSTRRQPVEAAAAPHCHS